MVRSDGRKEIRGVRTNGRSTGGGVVIMPGPGSKKKARFQGCREERKGESISSSKWSGGRTDRPHRNTGHRWAGWLAICGTATAAADHPRHGGKRPKRTHQTKRERERGSFWEERRGRISSAKVRKAAAAESSGVATECTGRTDAGDRRTRMFANSVCGMVATAAAAVVKQTEIGSGREGSSSSSEGAT